MRQRPCGAVVFFQEPALPAVVVRPAVAVVRVEPRLFLAPVVFGARVVTLPVASGWRATESLDRDDGWR